MIYRFNQLQLDTDLFKLFHSDQTVQIEPLAFDLLLYLVEHRDRVVSRSELLEHLWKDKVVTDAALAARIKDVRKSVGDNGSKQAVIKTLHGRGYQFIAPIETSSNESTRITEKLMQDTEFLALPEKPSIAVLPFTNLSNDPDQDYFSEGITDDIITALSKIKNMLVIARSSTANYRNQEINYAKIGREQGVEYLLQGNVRKAANRIRVTVQLINVSSGQHIWAESYDRELVDIFKVQDEIMREVVVALDVQLVAGEQAQAWSSGTTNLEAWECVRLAATDAIYDGKPEVKLRAKQQLQKALKIDPNYAIAWVLLGWVYQQYVDVASLATDDTSHESGEINSLASMLNCAQKAIAADPLCADAYSLLAMYHLEIKEFEQAYSMAEKSINLAPNNAISLVEASMVMNKTGYPKRALDLCKRVIRVCPMYRPGVLRGLGLSYYLLEQFDLAITAFKESIVRESEYLSAYTNLAAIYGELGQTEECNVIKQSIAKLDSNFSIESYMQGLSFSDPKVLARMEQGLRKAGLPE